MLDWNDLRYFLAIAHHGSTIAAAKVLKVSQPTVHRRIEELEARLGRHLVVRQATGYKLTEFGSAVVPLAEQVEVAVRSLERFVFADGSGMSGDVRITCSESVGFRLIQSGLLDSFQKIHPGTSVRLLMSDRFFDIAKGEADIAIRAGDQGDDTLVGKKIGAVGWGLYSSKSYLERHPQLMKAEQLASHSVIEFDGALKHHAAAKWLRDVAPGATIAAVSSSVPGLLVAVKSGVGVAPLPSFLASREPELAAIVNPIPGLESGIYLLTHPDLRRMPRVNAFFEFVTAEAELVRRALSGEK